MSLKNRVMRFSSPPHNNCAYQETRRYKQAGHRIAAYQVISYNRYYSQYHRNAGAELGQFLAVEIDQPTRQEETRAVQDIRASNLKVFCTDKVV